MTSRAESSLFAAGRDRIAAPTIVFLGAILAAGPVVAAVLLDRGHPMWRAVGAGALVQVVAALVVPGSGARPRRWLVGLAYAGLSWVLVFVLLQVLRSENVCTATRSVNTLDNAQLVVAAAAALLAVITAVAIAAAARLPHAGVVALVAAGLALALVVVPRIESTRVVNAWDALGHHYLPNDSYSTVCGRQVNLETRRRVEPTLRR